MLVCIENARDEKAEEKRKEKRKKEKKKRKKREKKKNKTKRVVDGGGVGVWDGEGAIKYFKKGKKV